MRKFWMVAAKPGKDRDFKPGTYARGIRYRHYCRAAAVVEAQRLAAKEDRAFAVLEAVEVWTPAGPERLHEGEAVDAQQA